MALKFALFEKVLKLPLNQGFQNRFLVTTVSRQALEMLERIFIYACPKHAYFGHPQNNEALHAKHFRYGFQK